MKYLFVVIILLIEGQTIIAQRIISSRTLKLVIQGKTTNADSNNVANTNAQTDNEIFDENYWTKVQTELESFIGESTTVRIELEKITNNNNSYSYNLKLKFDCNLDSLENCKITDFPSGQYLLSKSKFTKKTTELIKIILTEKINDLLKLQKTTKIKITGSADGVSIKQKIPYKNEFGEFINTKYFYENSEKYITITESQGITSNEQLAFLRTIGVRKYFENEIISLNQTNLFFEHHVIVKSDTGSRFRNVTIEIIIENIE